MTDIPPTANNEQPFIAGPLSPTVPVFEVYGLRFAVIADLPGGGFVQFVPGDNPLAQTIPGVKLQPGAMLAVVAPELALHVRPRLKQVMVGLAKGLEKPD
jgi:hypothetical protein